MSVFVFGRIGLRAKAAVTRITESNHRRRGSGAGGPPSPQMQVGRPIDWCENTAFHFHAAPFGIRSPTPCAPTRAAGPPLRFCNRLLSSSGWLCFTFVCTNNKQWVLQPEASSPSLPPPRTPHCRYDVCSTTSSRLQPPLLPSTHQSLKVRA